MLIELRYRRGPEITVYEHELLYGDERLIVTRAPFRPSGSLRAQVPELEMEEYRAVWFVIEGEWHDLGKIYDLNGALQGYYCDIIRPFRRTAEGLEIEDLFLDLWIYPNGRWLVLDEEEFEEAVARGWLRSSTAVRARRELERLIEAIESGRLPPQIAEWFSI